MPATRRPLRRALAAAAVAALAAVAAGPTTAVAGATPPPPWKDAAMRRAACGDGYPGAVTPPGYCAFSAASRLSGPRGITVDEAGDLLVVERFRPFKGRIRAYYLPPWAARTGLRAQLSAVTLVPPDEAINLNHGIAVRDGYLYASNDTTVFRWPYTAGARKWIGNAVRVAVVDGMPGGIVLRHYTRTLKFNAAGDLFMSIGSRQTDGVDGTPWRSMVKRYSAAVVRSWGRPRAPAFHWQRGETWALGLRNEVALAFDADGVLWGAENGNNVVFDKRLGGDITDDNPCTWRGVVLRGATGGAASLVCDVGEWSGRSAASALLGSPFLTSDCPPLARLFRLLPSSALLLSSRLHLLHPSFPSPPPASLSPAANTRGSPSPPPRRPGGRAKSSVAPPSPMAFAATARASCRPRGVCPPTGRRSAWPFSRPRRRRGTRARATPFPTVAPATRLC